MTPDMVADVGNTRVKWGRCRDGHVVGTVSLPPEPEAWEVERSVLPAGPMRWVVASVQPARAERLVEWLRGRGEQVTLLRHADLPVNVNVDQPHKVGIDRLLNAAAAISELRDGEPAVLVDAGSAVTVDYLDGAHVFQGGAIFPGLGLMARALHEHTALLPVVEVDRLVVLGKSTGEAIRSGILHAVLGGIAALRAAYLVDGAMGPVTYFTGGDSALLFREQGIGKNVRHWPEMTLTGILIAARGLP